MTRADIERLGDARDHLDQLHRHLARGDIDDEVVFDAVCMRLSAAIESVSRISEEPRLMVFGDVWPAIWSVRNRIAHGYVRVNRAIILATVDNDLVEFARGLDQLADLLGQDAAPGG